MAIFRTVQVSIWQDDFVIDLTPEEKFFFVYLLTNSRTTQCGIFCLPKRIIEFDTGYNRETVEKLINRFINYGKILYNETTKEIIILSWIKYNFINSRNTICCINKELKNVKNKGFVKTFFNLCKKYNYPLDSIFKDIDISDFTNKPAEIQQAEENMYQDSQEPVSTFEAQSKPLEEKEIELQPETSTTTTLKDVVEFFNNNLHTISPHECENITSWSEEMEYLLMRTRNLPIFVLIYFSIHFP